MDAGGECGIGCGVLENCNNCIDDYNDKRKKEKGKE
jgi:hypothetical protein